ncbi:MAG: sigma-70 family RNA polymerase sigma factor [Bacteroidales bacterium]|nr:sigma-70 family RNA polymerase sigma factor [Bacteroidales bacterium]
MTYDKFTDQMLIDAFVAGDKKCIEVLIQRYKDNVYSYILLNVKNPTLADDIFQDTFVKVISSLKSRGYSDEGKFLSWVIRISHNLIVDNFRNQKNMGTTSSDENEFVLNSTSLSDSTVEDRIVEDQIFADVKKLLDYLPPEQKEVVMLRHYGDLSFKEIADVTNVSINTALGRMRYAIMNLRRIVEEKNIILTK